MRYALLSHFDESAVASIPPEVLEVQMGRFIAFTEALARSGVLRDAQHLAPSSATTTVTVRDGERVTHDGPYAETKEGFGGWWIVEVDDLDTALEHAAACPVSEHGVVEVRPLIDLG